MCSFPELCSKIQLPDQLLATGREEAHRMLMCIVKLQVYNAKL